MTLEIAMKTDKKISLAEAAELSPNLPSANTLWRWCRRGLELPSGERVRLTHSQIGGRIFTTAADVQYFLRQVAEAGLEPFDSTTNTSAANK